MNKILFLKSEKHKDPYDIYSRLNSLDPYFIPLIKHTHVCEEAITLLTNDTYLKKLRYIIISSQRAVECLHDSIIPKLTISQKNVLMKKTIYSVGPATCESLLTCGFFDVRGGMNAGNGSILADIIVDETLGSKDSISSDQFLFLVGEIRKDIIPKKLSKAGIKVKEVVVYKTEELNDNLSRFKQIYENENWVVFFSSQGTHEIINYLKEKNLKIASIGPTTEFFLRCNNITPQIVSKKPEPLSLLNEILRQNSECHGHTES